MTRTIISTIGAFRSRGPRGPLVTFGLGMLLAAALTALPGAGAHAAVIDPLLSIEGDVTFDGGFSEALGTAVQTGTMDLTSGGVASQSTIDGDTVTGSDPLSGLLTQQTGDGVGASGSLSGDAVDIDESTLGIDLGISVANNSPTDTFKITFKVTFDNSVDADGPIDSDVFVSSEFTVDDPANAEVFFTDLTSDILFGDEENGNDPGTSGFPLGDGGMATFDLEFAPLSSGTLTAALTMEAGAFDADTSYVGNLTAFIAIDAVMNLTQPGPGPGPSPVPEPGSLTVFGAGLLALFAVSRRKRRERS